MATKKQELYITSKEALKLLSEQSGREITSGYLRLLAHQNKIRSRPIDGRTNEYLKADVLAYGPVKSKQKKEEISAHDQQPHMAIDSTQL